jgi:hypothetical protein
MIHRPQDFADILKFGLQGFKNFTEYVDFFFAEKYNDPKIPNFDWDPEIQLDYTYSQIEAEAGVYTMATLVDYDAQGNVKSYRTMEMSQGKIPRLRHSFVIDEDTIRTKTLMAMEFRTISQSMQNVIDNLLFTNVDKLLGGNIASLKYQRNQAVSTGKYVVTPENNKGGIQALTFDFNVPADNFLKTGSGAYGAKLAWSDVDADPIGDLRDMKAYAIANHLEYGRFEMCEAKWTQFIQHPKVRESVITTLNPTAVAANVPTMMIPEEVIKGFLVGMRLPVITVVEDDMCSVEEFNTVTRKIDFNMIPSFDQDVVVLIPNGDLGTIKAVKPIIIADPAARVSEFNGGRTKIVQTFNSDTIVQEIKSELTALVVPNKSRNFIILDTTAVAS